MQQNAAVLAAVFSISPSYQAPTEFNDEMVIRKLFFRDQSAVVLAANTNRGSTIDLIDDLKHMVGVLGMVANEPGVKARQVSTVEKLKGLGSTGLSRRLGRTSREHK